MPTFVISRRRPFTNQFNCFNSVSPHDKHSNPRFLDGETYDEIRDNYAFEVAFTGSRKLVDIMEGIAKAYPELLRDTMEWSCEERNGVTYLKSEGFFLDGARHFDIIHRSGTTVGLFFPRQVVQGLGENPGASIREGNEENL